MKRILLALMLGIGVLGFAQSEEEIVQKYIIDKNKRLQTYRPSSILQRRQKMGADGCEIQKNPYRFCVELAKYF